jgi:hypothetical protein
MTQQKGCLCNNCVESESKAEALTDWIMNRKPKTTFELQEKIDHIKGDWWLWTCVKHIPNGISVEGSVQADGSGEMVSEESFEKD